MTMLYDIEQRYNSSYKRVENLKEKDNPELILKLVRKMTAEGLSKDRLISYLYYLKCISERLKKSFLSVTEEDITTFLCELEQSHYSVYTKRDFKVALKKIFKFLGKENLVKDVRTSVKGSKKKLPEELLTKEEIIKMIEAADHPRDKAIIALLYEGGLRIGELASLKIKNIQFDDYGTVVKVRGKTGERVVRVVSAASLLAAWLEMHPRRDDKEALLLVNLSTNYKKKGITYQSIYQNLKRIAKKAGIKKKVTPHLFRHSRATHLARNLTEAEMNEYFGWVQGSDMPATYVHLSGRDVDDKILQIYNLKPKDKDREDEMRPIECPRCQYINAPVSRYCGRCGTVLEEGERVKLEVQSRRFAKDFPDLGIEDPRMLEEMKRFIDLIELFEKKPDLFNRMRAIVEGRT